ncbi:thioredoxin family protein [Maribacter litopenaei]|uniref:Thioredoxin family protein n=1 Tax=Maribacter litopenaei TaxID=2976127 RepID=A0ABY5Y8U0_9FLAO|nr:thioredoxin family protein [Maribacter litopenaei]UWX54376.1 thioredoxin family protein [Maribacter litopenaei]
MKTFLLCTIILGTTSILLAQSKNAEIVLNNNQKILVGKIDKTDLNVSPYANWFGKNYEDYDLEENRISKFEEKLTEYHIKIFMGTWCGDSKREVPRLFKILEHANFPAEKIQMVALDVRPKHYKKSPGEEEWGLQILRVPTIIFYKNGREVNRIIESPNSSLEKDIFDIIEGNSYIANKAKSETFRLVILFFHDSGLKLATQNAFPILY